MASNNFYPHRRSLLISIMNLFENTHLGQKIAWHVKPELRQINKKLKNAPPNSKIKDILTFEEFKTLWRYS